MTYDTTPEVDAIGSMALEGNVIPWSWYEALRFPSGKPDLNAIILLADIVYWYRPTPEHDETTGKVIGWKKRFKADLLQRSYASYAEQFGLTKRQVTDALGRLQNIYKVLALIFRTVETPQGKLPNVLFIKPIAQAIDAITHQRDTSHVSTGHLPRFNGTPPPIERETNTGITTEISTKNSQKPQPSASADPPQLSLMSQQAEPPTQTQPEPTRRVKTLFPLDPAHQAQMKQAIIDPSFRAWLANEQILLDVDAQWEAFTRKALANGYRYMSWRMAFMNWLTSDYQRPQANGRRAPAPLSTNDLAEIQAAITAAR